VNLPPAIRAGQIGQQGNSFASVKGKKRKNVKTWGCTMTIKLWGESVSERDPSNEKPKKKVSNKGEKETVVEWVAK